VALDRRDHTDSLLNPVCIYTLVPFGAPMTPQLFFSLERGSIQCANDLGEWVDDKYKIVDGVLRNEPITNDDIWRIVKAEGHSLRNFPDSSHKFFLALSKVLPSSCESCRVGRGKKYCKRFESLSSCRRDMNTYLGFPYFDD
jgi:hypothetical protein